MSELWRLAEADAIPPMTLALRAAEQGAAAGEVPVGAVIICNYRVGTAARTGAQAVAIAHNCVEAWNDPSAHAEIVALREAGQRLGTPRLVDCDLYVTLEPCAMCAAAIALARIRRLYFGAYDAKGGGVEHGARVFSHATCLHKPAVIGGLCEGEAAALLKRFFVERR